jgi:hypothetical protein
MLTRDDVYVFYIFLFDVRLPEGYLIRSGYVRVLVDCIWKIVF